MPTVHKREAATRDRIEHFVYLTENAGLDTAERFLNSAEICFTTLSRQPQTSAPLKLRIRTLPKFANGA
jgi:toxin ParE1/3/4